MVDALGVARITTVLGSISVALVPVPITRASTNLFLVLGKSHPRMVFLTGPISHVKALMRCLRIVELCLITL